MQRLTLARGRARPEARFPAAPARTALPQDYADALAAIKSRIRQERLRVVLSANAAMVLLYWDIGQMILARQKSAGWGAKVIDRLAADLCEAFPDMKGFSPRNLKYMRAFAAAWPERAIVQEPLARIPWYHHIALAFYDALETNDSAVKVRGAETLRAIARELVETVRNNVTIDWTLRENVRAQLRVLVERILREHGYPPDKQEKATQTVLEQAALLSAEWARA